MDNHTETPGCADGGRGHYDPCTCRPVGLDEIDKLVRAFASATWDLAAISEGGALDEPTEIVNAKAVAAGMAIKNAFTSRLSSIGGLERALRRLDGVCQDLRGVALEEWDFLPPEFLRPEWEALSNALVESAAALSSLKGGVK